MLRESFLPKLCHPSILHCRSIAGSRLYVQHVREVFSRFDIDLTAVRFRSLQHMHTSMWQALTVRLCTQAQFEEMCKVAGAAQVTGENYAGEVVTEERVKWAAVLSYWREESEDEL